MRDADEQPGQTLRVASIDICGDTTDLAVTQYTLDDSIGSNVKISPLLMFCEGFKVAGGRYLAGYDPALRTACTACVTEKAGLPRRTA
ncbi:MAG: virulence factor SrfB [Symbiopectobacterium sp.]